MVAWNEEDFLVKALVASVGEHAQDVESSVEALIQDKWWDKEAGTEQRVAWANVRALAAAIRRVTDNFGRSVMAVAAVPAQGKEAGVAASDLSLLPVGTIQQGGNPGDEVHAACNTTRQAAHLVLVLAARAYPGLCVDYAAYVKEAMNEVLSDVPVRSVCATCEQCMGVHWAASPDHLRQLNEHVMAVHAPQYAFPAGDAMAWKGEE